MWKEKQVQPSYSKWYNGIHSLQSKYSFVWNSHTVLLLTQVLGIVTPTI